MAPFAVYADDYTYIPIDDIEQYNAYQYWSLYGYNLDYSNIVSYTISESGTYNANYHGTFTSSFGGSESSSVNLHISNYTGSGALQNEITYGGIIVMSPSAPGVSGNEIDISLEADQTNNPTSSAPFVCRATGYSPGTDDWEYNEFTCTTTGGAGYQVFPDYDLVVDALNISNNGVGTLTIDLVNQGSSIGSFSGNLSGSNSGSLNGSISLSGTESTTNHKIYDIPVLNTSSIDNRYSARKRIFSSNNNPFIICFLANNYSSNYPVPYNSDGTVNTDTTVTRRSDYQLHPGYYFYCFEFSNVSNSVYLQYNLSYIDLIPLYVGSLNNMSDKLYRYIYGSDRTNELLESGNSNSQQAITNNESMTNSFNQASQVMHNIETTWENNLDTNMQNIPTSSSMYNDNKFIATANWVRTQFERIVLNTPFELLLVFSLILGIALVLIGKVR